jgi:hypothetical protein
MAASSKITAAFTATAQGMQKGIGKVVESLNKVTKASQKTNKQLSSLNAIGKFLVFDKLASYAARATGVLVRFGKTTFDVLNRTVQVATNVAEETSKSFQVFGDSAQSIIDFAKGASSLGLAEDQALQAAAGFGSLFKVIGSSEEEAAGFSKNLTKLAADMASFNNTTVDEALIALSAGLRGESEPLKRFAVFLNDATLKQEALNAGIIKSTKGTLQPAAKALAAYNVILKQTTQQQGDFARTAGGLANLSRIVTAQATNLAGAIGKSFEPIWRGAAEAISKALAQLEPLAVKVSEILQSSAEAVGEVISSIGDDYAKWIQSLDAEEVGLSVKNYFQEAAIAAATWYDTINAGIQEIINFFKNPPDWVEKLASFTGGTIDVVEKGTAGLASVQAKVGQLGTGALGIGAAIGRELGLVSEDTTDAIWETYKALGEVQKEFSAVANDFDGSNKANKEAAEAAKRANQKQEGLADKLKALFTNIEKNKLIGPRQQDGIIEKFSQDVSAALADSGKQAKEAAKQNKLSGLDARSQAGLNFLLESGVAGKKPEAETAKNTRPLPSILTELKAIPKTLSVSIP